MAEFKKRDGAPSLEEPIEAIELCTKCPYDECISLRYGCNEMKALKAALKAGKPYDGPPPDWGKKPDPQVLLDAAWAKMETASKAKPKPKSKSKAEPKVEPTPKEPAMTLEEVEPLPTVQHIKLKNYNEAIRALEVLHDVALGIGPEILEMVRVIKNDRSARFDHLIDWDAVAMGGSK